MGADWVFHNDADEFWWPVDGDLKETFETIPEDQGVVLDTADRVHPAARRPRVVRRALDDPRVALPAAAEDGPPHPPVDQAVVRSPDRPLGEARGAAAERPGGQAVPEDRGDAQGGTGARPRAGSRVPDRSSPLPAALVRAVPEEDRDRRPQPDVGAQRGDASAPRGLQGRTARGGVREPAARRRGRRDRAGGGMAGRGHRPPRLSARLPGRARAKTEPPRGPAPGPRSGARPRSRSSARTACT